MDASLRTSIIFSYYNSGGRLGHFGFRWPTYLLWVVISYHRKIKKSIDLAEKKSKVNKFYRSYHAKGKFRTIDMRTVAHYENEYWMCKYAL